MLIKNKSLHGQSYNHTRTFCNHRLRCIRCGDSNDLPQCQKARNQLAKRAYAVAQTLLTTKVAQCTNNSAKPKKFTIEPLEQKHPLIHQKTHWKKFRNIMTTYSSLNIKLKKLHWYRYCHKHLHKQHSRYT